MARISPGTAQTAPVRVHSEWGTSAEHTDSLLKFFTTITAFTSEDDAEGVFDLLRLDASDEALFDRSTGAETIGGDSFFVEYQLPYLITYEVTVRMDNVLYEFRWEGSNWGAKRDGHRLIETVLARFEQQDAYAEDEVLTLLPTTDETIAYGLDVQVEVSATPAA